MPPIDSRQRPVSSVRVAHDARGCHAFLLESAPFHPRSVGQHSMGTFYVSRSIEHTVRRTRSAAVPKILVDTGSGYTWVSASILERLGIKREKKDLEFV